MNRKIDNKRVFKLIRNLIIFISISTLILGIIGWNSFDSYQENINKTVFECEKNNPSYSKSGLSCGEMWLPLIDSERNRIDTLLLIGFISPIVFFGSKALINYIAPDVKKNK